MQFKTLAALALGASLVGACAAHATVLTNPNGLNFTPFPIVEYYGPGPQTFGDITWTSTNAQTNGGAVFGYDQGYGVGTNPLAFVSPGLVVAGLNNSTAIDGVTDSQTFTFGHGVGRVVVLMAYTIDPVSPTTISAFDVHGALLESFTLPLVSNPVGVGSGFFGFSEGTGQIGSFAIADGYNVVAFGVLTSPIPEPATAALGLMGVALLAAARRRAR